MKRTVGKMKQLISVLLMAAMVITCVPQTGLSVLAAENTQAGEAMTADVAEETIAPQNVAETDGEKHRDDEEMSSDGSVSAEDETGADIGIGEDVSGDDGSASDKGTDTVDEAVSDEEIGEKTPLSYVVTVIGTDKASVEFESTVQAAQAYVFTVEALEGYAVEDVRVYRTSEYEVYKNELDGIAVIETKAADTETEGRTRYTIAENVIDADLTIVVSAAVPEDEAGYTLATLENEVTSYSVALAAESAQVNVVYEQSVQAGQEYSFTVKAKDNYEIKDVKVYKTSDYDANKTDLSAATPIATTQENTATAGETKYTIAADAIDADITIMVTAEEADMEQCTIWVEYPRSVALRIGRVTYSVGDSTKFSAYSPTRGIIAQKGQTVKIKAASITTGYVAYVDKEGDGKEYLGSDGIYTIESAANETVTLELEEKTFDVSCEVLGVRESENESVTVRIPGSQSGELTGTVKANAALSVSVRAQFDKNERRVGRVAYQIGNEESVEVQLTDTQRRSGSVTIKIPRDVITGDVKITFTLEDIPKHKVTFNYDSARVRINFFTSSLELDSDDSVEVSEGSNDATAFRFKPVFTDNRTMFKVAEVTANGTVLKPGEETGWYTVRNITGSVNIEVSICLDETKCNSLTIAVEGHPESFTVSIAGLVDGDDDYGKNRIYSAGDKVLTQANELSATIRLDESYGSVQVKLDRDTIKPASEEIQTGIKTYRISFDSTKADQKTLRVYTKPRPTTESKTVTFSRTEDNRSAVLEVKETDGIKRVEGEEDKYTIASGASYFDFVVKMESSEFDPVLSYIDANGDTQELFYREKDSYGFNYSLAAISLPENAEIRMERKEVRKTVRVDYDKTEVMIAGAKIGTQEIEGTSVDKRGMSYEVPRGQTVAFSVRAQDNCKIVSAETTMNGEKTMERTETAGFTFYVTADTDSVTVIESEGLLSVRPLEEVSGAVLTPVNGVYNVSYGKSYRGGAMQGTEPFFHDEIEVKVNGTTVKSDSEDDLGIEVRDEAASFVLELAEEAAGKTVEVNLYEKDGEDDEGEGTSARRIKVASYKLKVSSVVTTVRGIPSGSVEQAINTRAEYAMILTPVNANLEVIEAESDAPSVVSVVREGSTLRLTTSAEADREANIKIYRKDDSVESGEKVLASFKVTTVKQLAGKQPGVSLKLAGNKTLKLTLSAPAGTVKPIVGGLYYKVTATPQTGTSGNPQPTDVQSVTKYIEKNDEASQDVELIVSALEDGNCTPWNFDVSVTMIQTSGELDVNGTNVDQMRLDESSAFEAVYATRKAYYEDKLKLKKGTTTVYTGQENVIVAIPQFGKDTTFTEVTVRDTAYPDQYVSDGTVSNERALTVGTDQNNNIIVSAPTEYVDAADGVGGTALGKHRLEVIAKSPDSMYASRATIDITVVRGIDALQVTTPSTSMYKADKTAASMKMQPVYNYGWSNAVPKAKKVTWEIVGTDEKALAQGNRLYGMVTVKNGTVTVNKNYKVSATESDNQFKVKVTGADYKNSNVSACSETITITSEGMVIGDVAVVAETIDGGWFVIARNEAQAPVAEREAQELEDTCVVAFAQGAPQKEFYTAAEAKQYIIRDNISYKSGNAKAVSVAQDGRITILKPAKKVKLTVSAEDGSKAKKEMTITVNDDPAGVLGVELWKYDTDEGRYDYFSNPVEESDDAQFEFRDSTAARFKLTVMQQIVEEDGEKYWAPITGNTNYKVTVSGAKVLNQNQAERTVEFVANGEVAKITVTNNGSGIKKGDKKSWTYTLTNSAFSKTKAPKVTLGSLRTGGWEQEVHGSFIKDVTTSSYAGMYAKIEVDWTAKTAKNEKALQKIENQLNPKGYFPLDDDGSFALRFNEKGAEWPGRSAFDAGSYKMKASVGTIDANGNFNPSRKETVVTLKVVKPKAASFKMTTSYTMAAADSGVVMLTGKGNYDTVSFSALKSANAKGGPNKFGRYFTLDDTTGQLKLTEAWYQDGKPAIDKSDLTGYVNYTARTFADYDAESNDPERDDEEEFCLLDKVTGTAKITVKFQDNAKVKYTLAGGSIYTDQGSTVKLPVTANKKPVELAYAIIKPESDSVSTWKIAHNDGAIKRLGEGCSEITLTLLKALDKNQKYAAELCIVPADSYYVNAIETALEAGNAEDAKSLIAQHGVAVKSSITAKDKAADASGQIKIAKSDLKQTFTSRKYDPEHGNYWLHIPYTKVYTDAEIEEIEVNRYIDYDGYDGLISRGWFVGEDGEEAGRDYIDLTLNKTELAKAVAAGKAAYGGKITLQTKVHYKGCEKTDAFKFELTLPVEAKYADYRLAVAGIEANKTKIAQNVKVNYWKEYRDDEWSDMSEEELGIELLNVRWQLWEAIKEFAGEDCDIDWEANDDAPGDGNTGDSDSDDDGQGSANVNSRSIFRLMEIAEGGLVKPTSTRDGSLTITARLYNKPNGDVGSEDDTESEQGTTPAATARTVSFMLSIKATGTEPVDMKAVLDAYATTAYTDTSANAPKLSNNTQYEDLMENLQDYVQKNKGDLDITNLRFDLWIREFPTNEDDGEDMDDYDGWRPATEEETGYITGYVHAYDIRYGAPEYKTEFRFVIPKVEAKTN